MVPALLAVETTLLVDVTVATPDETLVLLAAVGGVAVPVVVAALVAASFRLYRNLIILPERGF